MGMARGVDAALRDIIAEHFFTGVEGEEAQKSAASFLKELTECGRYLKDVWI